MKQPNFKNSGYAKWMELTLFSIKAFNQMFYACHECVFCFALFCDFICMVWNQYKCQISIVFWSLFFHIYLIHYFCRRRWLKLQEGKWENEKIWKAVLVSYAISLVAVENFLIPSHLLFTIIVYTNANVEQRKRKLVSLERSGDIETAVDKLIEQAARSNVERLKHAIKVKVKMLLSTCFLLCFLLFLYC